MSDLSRHTIPGAIILAGLIIAASIVFVRTPVVPRGAPAASPTAGVPAPTAVPVVVRPVDPARDHIRGKIDAPVTLVEYSDTECPFCKRFHPTLQQAVREYDGKVRWVYRHYPLEGLHQRAKKEAEATECASAQGKFWEYLDRLFEVTSSNDSLPPERLPEIAKDVGLDLPAFEQCLAEGRFAARVEEDLADAVRASGQGTPYTVILGPQGQVVPFSGAQPYANLQSILGALVGTP